MLPGLVWGFLGGSVGMFTEGSVKLKSLGGFIPGHLAGAAATAILGTILVGVIGEMLEGFTLSASGSFLGSVFIGSSWALGCTAGIYLFSRES
jgi:hypothetical protein